MNEPRFSLNTVLFVLFSVSAASHATGAFTQVDIEFFGTPKVVGVDSLVPGESAVLGFDVFPNGDPIPRVSSLRVSLETVVSR